MHDFLISTFLLCIYLRLTSVIFFLKILFSIVLPKRLLSQRALPTYFQNNNIVPLLFLLKTAQNVLFPSQNVTIRKPFQFFLNISLPTTSFISAFLVFLMIQTTFFKTLLNQQYYSYYSLIISKIITSNFLP